MRDQCILKGASLLALWMQEPYRATRDVDLLDVSSKQTSVQEGIELAELGIEEDMATWPPC